VGGISDNILFGGGEGGVKSDMEGESGGERAEEESFLPWWNQEKN